MDLPALFELLKGASDRVILIAVFIIGVRYLVKRTETQTELLTGLFKEADGSRVTVANKLGENTEALNSNTQILRLVEKKL